MNLKQFRKIIFSSSVLALWFAAQAPQAWAAGAAARRTVKRASTER